MKKVAVDRATALNESAFYAGNPGIALSYQVGKHQLMRLIADTIENQGDSLNFKKYMMLFGKMGTFLLFSLIGKLMAVVMI